MGMRAKWKQITTRELESAKQEPAKFYRELYGITGPAADKDAMMMDLAQQMSKALQASEYGRQFTELPEARRIAEATKAGKAPDPADQQKVMQIMMELLPKINFRPDLSALSKHAPQKQRVPDGLELEKSWHCLHYILTGKVWETGDAPIEQAVLGGAEIPDTESVMGYGPARYLTAAETKEVSAALDAFPIEEKAKNFDQKAAAQADIYVPEHEPQELAHYFGLLKDYFRDAAAKDSGMLMWIE